MTLAELLISKGTSLAQRGEIKWTVVTHIGTEADVAHGLEVGKKYKIWIAAKDLPAADGKEARPKGTWYAFEA